MSYSTTTAFHGPNTFARFDYHVNSNNQISFRWTREAVITERDSIENDLATLSAARHENDSGDQVFSGSWTSVVNNRMTNEFKIGHVRENLLQGPSNLFDADWNFIGFAGVDPFDVGSQNTHPDYIAGPRNTYAQDLIRDVTIDNTLSWVKSGWGGDHMFKVGAAYSRNGALPQGTAVNFTGVFTFPTNANFNPADPTTYPYRFGISMGQYDFEQIDHRASGYIQDKWQVNSRLTLNIGVRYDWQELTENTKDAIGPRFGFAYDATGDGKTVIRGGFGKVYQYQQLAVLQTLLQRTVMAPTFAYDTTQVTSPAITGTFPVGPNANATACLNPVASPTAGVAIISPACRAFLNTQRGLVAASPVINNTTTGPLVDGDRRMAYTWAFSAGVKRELTPDDGGVDRLRRQSRPGQHRDDRHQRGADQSGDRPRHPPRRERVRSDRRAGAARGARRDVRPVQPEPDHGARLGARHARSTRSRSASRGGMSNRWSGRVSYTLSHCYDVASIIVDSNPRLDYGRCDRDNIHAFATSAYVDIGKGFGGGIVFRAYSGYPINETVGTDVNGDGTNNDRPMKGVNDIAALPSGQPSTILSAVDDRGVAVRNGIDGEKQVLLDGRFQYIARHRQVPGGVVPRGLQPAESRPTSETRPGPGIR